VNNETNKLKKESNNQITLLDIFKEEPLREKSDGNYQTACPCCQNDYGGLLLNIETNTSYCFKSRKWFDLKETYALKKGIITCDEGRNSE